MKKIFYAGIKGFTLAEVLVTLAVIGIVAALTVPSLLKNYQEKQWKTAWKKQYSQVSQGMLNIQRDHGGSFVNFVGQGRTLAPEVNEHFGSYKYSDTNSLFTLTSDPAFDYKDLSGNSLIRSLFDDGQFILKDGSFLAIENAASNPIIIWVDVNGFYKGPNTLGKDLYGIKVLNDRILPLGASGSGDAENTCTTTGNTCADLGGVSMSCDGAGCSAEFLKN